MNPRWFVWIAIAGLATCPLSAAILPEKAVGIGIVVGQLIILASAVSFLILGLSGKLDKEVQS